MIDIDKAIYILDREAQEYDSAAENRAKQIKQFDGISAEEIELLRAAMERKSMSAAKFWTAEGMRKIMYSLQAELEKEKGSQ